MMWSATGSSLKHLARVRAALDPMREFDELMALGVTLAGTPFGSILSRAANTLKNALNRPIAAAQVAETMETVAATFDSATAEYVYREEAYLPVLSTSAAVAPLIGLFGTVWGLIHSFVRMAEFHSADITTVAPGIAEALITTLAGLLVAIPAMLMFHVLQARVRTIEQQLQGAADRALVFMHAMIQRRGA